MITDYEGKQILVLGMAKSGFAASVLLHRLGAKVIVNDMKPLEENPLATKLHEMGLEVICGHHPLDLLERGIECIVKNPGIPYSNPILQKAAKKGIPIITEVELAYKVSEAPFVGITGSNGKTTTTTLIFEMLNQGNKHPLIAGNIGTVACEVAQTAKADNVIVTELSSFQLMGIQEFRPKIAVLLNLFDAHLDYHATKKEYGLAKASLFKNQTGDDYSIINADDDDVMELSKLSKAKKIYFSTSKVLQDGACIKNGALYFKGEEIIKVQDIALPGKHNLQNILAALCVVKLWGTPNEAIESVLQTFGGVKHRTQYVTTIDGRKFYNDSKATNILATQAAISAFEQPVILLAGGLDRGNAFDELIPYFTHVKALVVFGQTAPKLIDAGKQAGMKQIKHVDNVEQAVQAAYELSESGDIILLSPACASWDQFKTFEERGDMFIQAVHKLV
nr:UDP-N-acetylmuramoyl-L-alanine--D-glutamate ligase [Bacillus sp. 165]